MQTHSGYVSANDVISDILPVVDDPGQKKFPHEWYIQQIQNALTELAYDTYFDERKESILIEGCSSLQLPSGLVNLKAVYLFNGDKCMPGIMQTVWHARNYVRDGEQQFKEQRGTQVDPIMDQAISGSTQHALYYYNTMGDRIMLSDACRAYQKLFVVYNGLGCDFGSTPTIPHFLREAVKCWVAVVALEIRNAQDRGAWSAVLATQQNRLHGDSRNPGAWMRAKRRVQSSDEKEMRDLSKYLTGLNAQLI